MTGSTSVEGTVAARKAALDDPTPLPPVNTLRDAPESVRAVLTRLHKISADQEAGLNLASFVGKKMTFDEAMQDKFIALEEDKCHYMYTLLRAIGATSIVEAGTSYGVSTIYLALAVQQNAAASPQNGRPVRVIATEHELAKAEKARAHWAECGAGISDIIDLRVGDLRETLKTDVEAVDFLLLDIWTPMALPTLKLVQPKMRRGAVVLTDNTISAGKSYRDLLTYLRDPVNGFTSVTLPYKNGLEFSVYQP